MKSHQLAKLLLSLPDSHVLIETSTGRDEVSVRTKEWRTVEKSGQNGLILVRRVIDRTD